MGTQSNKPEKQDILSSLKATVALIITTGLVVSGIWAFFFIRTSDIKDEQIKLLERQNTVLRETGPVPEAVKRLEEKIIPLTLAFPIDPFNGRVKVGTGIETASRITTLIIDAEKLRGEKKFDIAAAKLEEVEKLHQVFPGISYFRFLIEKDKGNMKEALALAERTIKFLPDDPRILLAYEFAVKANLQFGEKKRAEDLCLKAISLDPENKRWRDFFKVSFGYEPAITEKKQ